MEINDIVVNIILLHNDAISSQGQITTMKGATEQFKYYWLEIIFSIMLFFFSIPFVNIPQFMNPS